MYFIFSLLLMILGINTAYAGVTWGGAITNPSTLTDGSKIVIHTNEGSGTFKFLSALQDSAVYANMEESVLERYVAFTLEVAEGKTIKDKQAYYLKNDYNGKYVTYVFDEKNSIVDGHLEMRIKYTDTKENAIPIIIESARTAVAWFDYSLSDEDQEKVTDATMMIISECTEQSNRLIALNSNFAEPYIATYGDYAAWWQVGQGIPTDSYIVDLDAVYNKVKNLNYIGGTAPGCYDATLVENFDNAKAEVAEFLYASSENPTEEKAKELLEKLENAYFAILNANEYPVREGYFRIVSAYSGFSNKTAIAGNSEILKWAPLDETNPSQVWKLIDRKDGTWNMYNIGEAQYVAGVKDGKYALANDSTGNAVKFVSIGQSQFNVKTPGYSSMHTNGWSASGDILLWDSEQINGGSAWYITEVPADKIDSLLEVGEQNRLNRELETLYNKANEKYAIGSRYNIVKDADKWLVTTTDLENNPLAVYSNADHNTLNPDATDGGGYPALLDADSLTYWHSCWKNIPEEAPYLQFALNKPVSTFAVYITRRIANNQVTDNQATDIYFEVTNDTTNGEWIQVGSINGLPASGSVPSYQSTGFELGQEYQFVRVTWKSANGFTHFSGFHFQEASLDPTCQNATMPNGVATKLKAEMNNALTLIQTGKATQEAIDALTKAYNDYIGELADPTELTAKTASMKDFCDKAATPSMTKQDGTVIFTEGQPGVYTDDAKNAFKAVITDAENYINGEDYDKEGIALHMKNLDEAYTTFKNSAPKFEIAATEESQNGIWYKISYSQHYFDYTGNAQDATGEYVRKGRLYVDIADPNTDLANNLTINVTGNKTLDELGISEDKALWKFVNLGDTAVAIQNKATGLYIGEKRGGNAGLSIQPVAFKIEELGYATFLFEGYRFDGEGTNPLHIQTNGQTLVYWGNRDLGGGSCFDIEKTSDEGTGVFEFPYIEEVVKGQLYTRCYPVDINYASDDDDTYKMYQIATLDKENKQLTLTQIEDEVPAGTPVFFVAGNGELTVTTDTTFMYVELPLNDKFVQTPSSKNGLIGTFYPTNVGKGYGYIATDEEGKQSIGQMTADQSTAWNSGYIDFNQIVNAENPGELVVPISADLETAIKDAIINAQNGNVNVYSIDGVLIKKNVKAAEATKGLAKGIYIVGTQKIAIK